MVKKGHGLIIVVLTIRPTQPYLASLVNGKNVVSIFSEIVYTQNPPRLEKYVHFTSIRGYLTDRPLTTRTLNSILAKAESCMRSPGLQRLVCMYMYVRTFRGFILSALCASLFQNPQIIQCNVKTDLLCLLNAHFGQMLAGTSENYFTGFLFDTVLVRESYEWALSFLNSSKIQTTCISCFLPFFLSVFKDIKRKKGLEGLRHGSRGLFGLGQPGGQDQNVSVLWSCPCCGVLLSYQRRYGIR